jgi:enediyne biosynthesis protein E2
MPTVLGSLRRLALTPSLASVTFERRGFPPAEPAIARWLEAIPHAVVCGFEWGIDARDQWELERRLELVEPGMRGFAYEGATMALTVLDAMSPGRRSRTRELLLGAGAPHIFLAYIGIGFAMNHLPRALWRKVLPDLPGNPFHPTMSWLAVDGYGFDLAYFDVRRYVERQAPPAPYPWQGRPDYFPRAADQGIGRALWFIQAARVADVDAAVRRFAADRQADLWSGIGLAATFAGGCGHEGLSTLRRLAGPHASQLALGSVFAAKARAHAGFVPPHSAVAVAALAGLTVHAAAALADDTEPAGDAGTAPAYEVWRANIRRHLAAVPQAPAG